MPKHPGRTALYRLYDETDQLLYIGISRNPDVRWGQHSLTKDWWPQVAKRTVDWHETRVLAEAAELVAIGGEKPLHNVVGTPDHAAKPMNGNTPPRQIRIGDEWYAFDDAAKAMGTERAAVIREFIAWYLKEPGARLPKRPEREAWITATTEGGE